MLNSRVSLQEILFQGGGVGSLGDGGAVVVDGGDAESVDLGDRDGLVPLGGGPIGGHDELAINHPEGAQGSNGKSSFVHGNFIQSATCHVIRVINSSWCSCDIS